MELFAAIAVLAPDCHVQCCIDYYVFARIVESFLRACSNSAITTVSLQSCAAQRAAVGFICGRAHRVRLRNRVCVQVKLLRQPRVLTLAALQL